MSGCVISRAVMSASEPEALEGAIHSSHLNASLLGRSHGLSSISRMAFSDACLDTAALSAPMLFTGEMPRDRLTMIYVRQCPADGHSFNFSTTHRSGVVGAFAPGCELDAATPAGYVNATLSLPVAALGGTLAGRITEIPDDWMSKGAVLTLPPVARQRLDAFLKDLESWSRSVEASTDEPGVAARVEEELIDQFFGATVGVENELRLSGRGHLRRRYAMMRRVRAYLREHAHSPMRVDELCEAVGMSRRGLEYLFKDLLGIGVNAFIRHQRLHGARQAILRSGPSPGGVKRIALEWGFWHLGRFSADYKAQFGELPTTTMARLSRRS